MKCSFLEWRFLGGQNCSFLTWIVVGQVFTLQLLNNLCVFYALFCVYNNNKKLRKKFLLFSPVSHLLGTCSKKIMCKEVLCGIIQKAKLETT